MTIPFARAAGTLPLALLALLPVPAAGQGAVEPEVLTLEQAVERALRHSPAVAQSRQQILNAEQGIRTTWGTFLPSLSADARGSLRSSERFDAATDRIVSGSSDSYNAGVDARYTLYDGGARFRELAQSRAEVGAAEAGLADQRWAIILQTEQMFFQVLRQEELVEVAEGRLAQAEESLELTRRQAQLGSATTSDTLRARLELVNARQAVLEAETALHTARVALGRQVGVAGPVGAVPPEDIDPAPLALSREEILELAASDAPSVRAATASETAAGAAVASARSAYLPSVSLGSGYNWANQSAALEGGTTSWSLSMGVSYPIFNGFQREATVARAEGSLEVARRQREDERLAARQAADEAVLGIETAEQALQIAQEAVAVAEEDLRVVRERFRLGVATIFEVLTSQVALDQAQVDLVNARYDYVLARAGLEAILGREV